MKLSNKMDTFQQIMQKSDCKSWLGYNFYKLWVNIEFFLPLIFTRFWLCKFKISLLKLLSKILLQYCCWGLKDSRRTIDNKNYRLMGLPAATHSLKTIYNWIVHPISKCYCCWSSWLGTHLQIVHPISKCYLLQLGRGAHLQIGKVIE